MPTPPHHLLALPIFAVLVTVGCSAVPTSSGDLDRRTGCSLVVAERTMAGEQVVVDVRAAGCRGSNGMLLPADLAVDRVAQAVWQSLELPVDAVMVTVSEAGASPEDAPTIISGDELAERFGEGPAGAVWPVSARSDETIWVILPVAYLAAGLAMVLLVRRLRRAGIVVVLLRR